MEIVALVGTSGTGKSHRAGFVAREYKTDLIIDDGLIIKGTSILGGMSAKSQPTALGAVRTALFTDDKHAKEAMDIIAAEHPDRVLLLGTSLGMVNKIASRLHLSLPQTIVRIEDIATEKEMQIAKDMRNNFGKHVIPAPTAEVKKSLSGIIMDPLHVMLRLKNTPKAQKAIEKTLVRPRYFLHGKICIADNVIDLLTKRVVGESALPVTPGKTLVEQGEDGTRLNLTVNVKYGVNIPTVIRELQLIIKERIEYFTGLTILSIDIIVKKFEM